DPDVPNTWKWSLDLNDDSINDSSIILTKEAALLMEKTGDSVSSDGLWHLEGNPLDANTWEIIDYQGDIWKYKEIAPKYEIADLYNVSLRNVPEVEDLKNIDFRYDVPGYRHLRPGILKDILDFVIDVIKDWDPPEDPTGDPPVTVDNITITIGEYYHKITSGPWTVSYGLWDYYDHGYDDGLIIYQAIYNGRYIIDDGCSPPRSGAKTPWVLYNGNRIELRYKYIEEGPNVQLNVDGLSIRIWYDIYNQELGLDNIGFLQKWIFNEYHYPNPTYNYGRDGSIHATTQVTIESPESKHDNTIVLPYYIDPRIHLKTYEGSSFTHYIENVEYYKDSNTYPIGTSKWVKPTHDTRISVTKDGCDNLLPVRPGMGSGIPVKMKFYHEEEQQKAIFFGPYTHLDPEHEEDHIYYYVIMKNSQDEDEKDPDYYMDHSFTGNPQKVQFQDDVFWYKATKTIKESYPDNGVATFGVDIYVRRLTL
ncbi:MAG: hypothetical protein JSV09_07180, partial [Thermoplasmata archaeon]